MAADDANLNGWHPQRDSNPYPRADFRLPVYLPPCKPQGGLPPCLVECNAMSSPWAPPQWRRHGLGRISRKRGARG